MAPGHTIKTIGDKRYKEASVAASISSAREAREVGLKNALYKRRSGLRSLMEWVDDAIVLGASFR